MNTPLLATKFSAPPSRSDLVPRQRLMARLSESTSNKLTLISAPAGFGKTTLMSTWHAESGLPSAWLSLDPEDDHATRFLIYLATALGGIAPEVGQTSLAMLQSTQPSPLENVLTVLINELSTISQNFVLFLDDYHFIEAQEIHSALAFLVEHLPHNMHIVLASRSDPPLPLSQLRARGQLAELRQAELRFSPEEAADFLNRSIGLALTAEQVATLESRTEGWIAGLQLAALSMRGREDQEAFIQAFSGSHRYVIDYLADQVYSKQPDNLRQFLRETSLLDQFTESLCIAVTGRNDSGALIQALEAANLFLIPLDDQRQWYRYHQLFGDFLRARLDELEKSDLHKRASQWFMSNGMSTEAVKHALASRDMEMAVQIISSAADQALKQAEFHSLLGWLDALPEQTVRTNLVLSISKGFVLLLTRSFEEALPYAQAAEKCLTADAPMYIQGKYLSLKANLSLCEDKLDSTIQFSREALEYLDEEDQFFRNLTLNILGQVLEMKGDIPSAVDIYRQAFEAGWRAGDRLGSLVVFTNMVFSLNELGRRREAVDWCKKIVAESESQDTRGLPVLNSAYLTWSLLAYEANELIVARDYVQRAMNFLNAANFPLGISWGQYILARINLAEGDFDHTREITQEGRRLASQIGRDFIQGAWFAALEAQVDLESGALPSALRWAERAGYTPQDSPHHWFDQPYFTYARILMAQERLKEAQTLLSKMEELASQGGRQRKLITIYLLYALTLLAQEETQPAMVRVERALELAAPQDYRRAFLDEGQEIAQLLLKARHAAPAFADELLLAFRSPTVPPRQVEVLIDPLSEREQEVLRLVAKGLSNREISVALFITLGTVKKHLNNVFNKLQVNSRTQAVARGRELRLFK